MRILSDEMHSAFIFGTVYEYPKTGLIITLKLEK